MRFRATPAKPKPPTRTSSPSGKTPTPIFPSSSLRRPNTQNYSRSLLKFCDQVLPAPGKWLARTCARHRPQKDWLSGLGIVFLLAKNDAGWKVETSRRASPSGACDGHMSEYATNQDL